MPGLNSCAKIHPNSMEQAQSAQTEGLLALLFDMKHSSKMVRFATAENV